MIKAAQVELQAPNLNDVFAASAAAYENLAKEVRARIVRLEDQLGVIRSGEILPNGIDRLAAYNEASAALGEARWQLETLERSEGKAMPPRQWQFAR